MNTIAAQIDYAADILKATNDLLEARANHRLAQNNGSSIHAVIDAQVKVLKAELALKDLIEPADYVPDTPDTSPIEPDCCSTKAEHDQHRRELKSEYAQEQYQRRELMNADERADDPRRYEETK